MRPAITNVRIRAENPQSFSTECVHKLRHNLQNHPLMQLEQLARLAKIMWRTQQCRFILPDTQETSSFAHDPNTHDGRTIDEVFARIEEPGSWVALYNVESDPVYRDFLSEVASCMRPLVEPQQPGMFNVGGFIFISAPPSVTPFHIDRENNFWLQVKGRKTLSVWNSTDRQVLPALTVEEFILYGSLDKVCLTAEARDRCQRFDVGPGEGVYFPSTSPHMTRTDAGSESFPHEVSISVGIVFYTRVTKRVANVHAFNNLLRRLGLSPLEPGRSIMLDRIKYPLGKALIWFRTVFRRYKPQSGM